MSCYVQPSIPVFARRSDFVGQVVNQVVNLRPIGGALWARPSARPACSYVGQASRPAAPAVKCVIATSLQHPGTLAPQRQARRPVPQL